MIEINTRAQLEALLKGGKPKTVNERICPVCQCKQYRIFVKGVERWQGCKCSQIRAHHHI